MLRGGDRRACFRHALAREALYADVPWARRRTLHRALAEALERAGAPQRRGRRALARRARARARPRRAAARGVRVRGRARLPRRGADAGRQALELWPAPARTPRRRADVLERYARCCQLAGELAEAARAWRELVALRTAGGDERAVAQAQRGLAAALELAGRPRRGAAARAAAADAFAATGAPAEAAVERLAIANQRRLSPRHGEAIALARTARADADARRPARPAAPRARASRAWRSAKHGDYARRARDGPQRPRARARARPHRRRRRALPAPERDALRVGRLPPAEAALDTALELCRASPDAGTEVACVTCMAYVLRERGAWARAARAEPRADRAGPRRVRRRGHARRRSTPTRAGTAPPGACSRPRSPPPRACATTT